MPETDCRPKRRLAYRTVSAVSFCAILALWCLLTYGGLVSEIFVPSPSKVLAATVEMAKEGSLWRNCWMSVKRVMVGWFWFAVAALPIGMCMARSKRFSAAIQPVIEDRKSVV